MSRIGNAPITVAKEATITLDGSTLVVKGPKGELKMTVPMGVVVEVKDGIATVTRKHNDKATRALHGAIRAAVFNMVEGVTKGWTRTLEMSGVGYRANLSGANLVLSVGFSHQVTITPPEGITFATADGKITISGIDKQHVGQIAAKIRGVKKPEPYKGKGIKYEGERIRKKAGKAKAVGGAPGAK
jgi:large subunit ribosomal protein L6